MNNYKSKQEKIDNTYMRMAIEWGKLSYCSKNKVGALIVKDRTIISDGYNGTPTGFENKCEDIYNKTKWYVLHAEANAILKIAKSNNSSMGSVIYITVSPCKDCSKLIHQAGIIRVVYLHEYKNSEGIDFLIRANVKVDKIIL